MGGPAFRVGKPIGWDNYSPGSTYGPGRPTLGQGKSRQGWCRLANQTENARADAAELERLRAENAALRAELAALRDADAARSHLAALRQLAEGVIITDAAGRISFVNAAAERIHGVARLDVAPDDYSATYSLFTEDGRPYPPQDLPLARAVLRGEGSTDARWRIRRPDGTEVVAVGSACPIHAEDGRQLGAVLAVRDETARDTAERGLRESLGLFRLLVDGLPMLVAYVGPDLRYRVANHAYRDWFGLDPREVVGKTVPEVVGEGAFAWVGEHIKGALAGRRSVLEGWVPYGDKPARFVRAEYIPHVTEDGRVDGLFICALDETARRAGEERERLLMREVDHRAKNTLAVVQAILRLTRAESRDAFLEAVESRIGALARAQAHLSGNSWTGAPLAQLVREGLSPFLDGADGRLVLDGPDLTVAADAVQSLAMLLHELATNAAKYGALSQDGGRLLVRWQGAPGQGLDLRWQELGGPTLSGQPDRRGFGSEMLLQATLGQLRGQIEHAWEPGGLGVRLTLPADSLTA